MTNRRKPKAWLQMACVLLAASVTFADPEKPTTTPPPKPAPPSKPTLAKPILAETAQGKRVQYAKGILIDWSIPQVEIKARVVQTDLPIELLLCLENTKEHESILATSARPKKIFEALGLIGASPGKPMSFDPGSGKQTKASGQPLTIDVSFEVDGKVVRKGAHDLMIGSKTKKPIAPLEWVFCGSSTLDGKFTADGDGTIACVVDFSTALIGLAEPHSSSDSKLWVLADKNRVPPKGTACTVIIRSKNKTAPSQPPSKAAPSKAAKTGATKTGVIKLTLTPEGFFQLDDEILDALALDVLIKERIKTNPDQKVSLSPMQVEPEGVEKMNLFARLAGRAIIGSGINEKNLSMTLLDEPAKKPTSAAPTSPASVPEKPAKPKATPASAPESKNP